MFQTNKNKCTYFKILKNIYFEAKFRKWGVNNPSAYDQ